MSTRIRAQATRGESYYFLERIELGPDFGWRGFVSSAERPVEVGEIRESEIERN